MFSWYWLADLCESEGIEFVLGHAYYMKSIHGGKAKNDRIDSEKIADLLRSGHYPLAHHCPHEIRAVRDLMRRRTHLVHIRAELLGHIQITNHQYNLPAFEKAISKRGNRDELLEHFPDPVVRKNVEADLATVNHLHTTICALEVYIRKRAKIQDPQTYHLLKSINGVGDILALTLMYEIIDVCRFPSVQQFCSYGRLVKCAKESAGKKMGFSGTKIGNPHIKWAITEASVIFKRNSDKAKHFVDRLEKKHGKGKSMSILAHKLGRAIYFMMKRKDAFDEEYFFKSC
jgi:transposase